MSVPLPFPPFFKKVWISVIEPYRREGRAFDFLGLITMIQVT